MKYVRPIVIRAVALGVAMTIALVIVLGSGPGPGLHAMAVGSLFVLVVMSGGTFIWSARDTRRASGTLSVVLTWLGVFALLLVGYLIAARLFGTSQSHETSLPELAFAVAIPGALCLALPAALGIVVGVIQRAQR